MFAIGMYVRPPSVLSAIGTVFSVSKRYVRNRLPYSSNARLGSQHALPSASPSPMMRRAHVAPPSKLTAANMPAPPRPVFVTTAMLLGFVGLTAIVSSDSLPWRWLTSTLGGGGVDARATVVEATKPMRDSRARATSRRERFMQGLLGG